MHFRANSQTFWGKYGYEYWCTDLKRLYKMCEHLESTWILRRNCKRDHLASLFWVQHFHIAQFETIDLVGNCTITLIFIVSNS